MPSWVVISPDDGWLTGAGSNSTRSSRAFEGEAPPRKRGSALDKHSNSPISHACFSCARGKGITVYRKVRKARPFSPRPVRAWFAVSGQEPPVSVAIASSVPYRLFPGPSGQPDRPQQKISSWGFQVQIGGIDLAPENCRIFAYNDASHERPYV